MPDADERAARKDEFRVAADRPAKPPKKLPTKLDVGCAFRKPAGYWGIDRRPFAGVDQVVDLNHFPWPLPTNHFTKIRLWHILQYLPDTEEVMREIWRIAAPNAQVIIGVPYCMSTLAFGDRNKSFFNEHTFEAFTDASWYAEQRDTFTSGAQFALLSQTLRATGRLRRLIPFKNFFKTFLWNIYDELETRLVVKKT